MQFEISGTFGEYNDANHFTSRRDFKAETLGEVIEHLETFLRSMGYNFDSIEVRNSHNTVTLS